jgi:hypothetical protein
MLALGLKGEATGERKSDSICVFVIRVITHARPATAGCQGWRADRLVTYGTVIYPVLRALNRWTPRHAFCSFAPPFAFRNRERKTRGERRGGKKKNSIAVM